MAASIHALSVHGIADPRDGVAGLLYGGDVVREVVIDLPRAVARNERDAPALAVRVDNWARQNGHTS